MPASLRPDAVRVTAHRTNPTPSSDVSRGEDSQATDGGTASSTYRTRAVVIVPGLLSYCLVHGEDHLDALAAQYPAATLLTSSTNALHDSSPVALWFLEDDPPTASACFYHPFHLDYGPYTWMQCAQMLSGLRHHRQAILEWRQQRQRHLKQRQRREGTAQARRDGVHDFDVPSVDDEQEAQVAPPLFLVVVRLYLGLERATNLIAALGVMAVLAGALTQPRDVLDMFPLDSVMSWTVPFHDATPYDDVEAFFDLNCSDVILAALHAFNQWPSELSDVERFVVAHDYFARLENGDISWVVPWRLAAFASPNDVEEDRERQQPPHHMHCTADGELPSLSKSAEYYGNVFGDHRGFYGCVHTVVQLNDNVAYSTAPFVRRGMKHEKLLFEDGSFPKEAMVARFFNVYDAVPAVAPPGRTERPRTALALHCMAGLGRTGTLIALVLMRDFGFTAKWAIAWCRLCRPGSVIGPQQNFLCFTETVWKRSVFERRRSTSPAETSHTQTFDQAWGYSAPSHTSAKVTVESLPADVVTVDRSSLVEVVVNRNNKRPTHKDTPEPLESALGNFPNRSGSGSAVVAMAKRYVDAGAVRPIDISREAVVETRRGSAQPQQRDSAQQNVTDLSTKSYRYPSESAVAATDSQRRTEASLNAAAPSQTAISRDATDSEGAPRVSRRQGVSTPRTKTYTVGVHSVSPSSRSSRHKSMQSARRTLSTQQVAEASQSFIGTTEHQMSSIPPAVQAWIHEEAQRIASVTTPPRVVAASDGIVGAASAAGPRRPSPVKLEKEARGERVSALVTTEDGLWRQQRATTAEASQRPQSSGDSRREAPPVLTMPSLVQQQPKPAAPSAIHRFSITL